jgi:hypothetical protein
MHLGQAGKSEIAQLPELRSGMSEQIDSALLSRSEWLHGKMPGVGVQRIGAGKNSELIRNQMRPVRIYCLTHMIFEGYDFASLIWEGTNVCLLCLQSYSRGVFERTFYAASHCTFTQFEF